MQPRYGFTVQSNGIADAPGTWFSALLHMTSWNVTPANSGVVTERTRPFRCLEARQGCGIRHTQLLTLPPHDSMGTDVRSQVKRTRR